MKANLGSFRNIEGSIGIWAQDLGDIPACTSVTGPSEGGTTGNTSPWEPNIVAPTIKPNPRP